MVELQHVSRTGRQLSSSPLRRIESVGAVGLRVCRIEDLEERRFLAADIHLGAVYFEDASGDDSQGDTIQISFEGGVEGTELKHLVIDGDKTGDGPSAGDIFFDTAAGGLGAFGFSPLKIVSSDGFQVLNYTVSDGGSRITFDLAGFKAGMKLVFTVDTDEIQFVDSATGEQDVNGVVEGAEFQRTRLDGTFEAPHFHNAVAHALFWDAYDDEFAAEEAQTGTQLNLPPDRYSTTSDLIDRTAGAVASVAQVPLPISLSGTVFEDLNSSNTQQQNEPGIGDVSLSLLVWNGSSYVATGKTTVTNANGDYKFEDLAPGKYRIIETQPGGYSSVGATAGKVDGATRGVVDSVDVLSEINLAGGDISIDNDFAEARPSSISGYVHADVDGDCVFDANELPIAGVVIQLLDAAGHILQTTTTDATGHYRFDNLAAGEYQIRELQPMGYFDGGDHPGSEGGVVLENDLISHIVLGPGKNGVEYHFCEIPPAMLCGYVFHDANNNGIREPGEQGIAGVSVALWDANGVYTGQTEITDANGRYCFDDLEPGTYRVHEVQPVGWIDGLDSPGSAGGVAQNPGDTIIDVVLTPGLHGEDYNFGELLPASIRGRVHADTNGNCQFDPGEKLIAGVVIELRNAAGTLIASTSTNAAGEYEFAGLVPGAYTIHEVQPGGYFDGGQDAGSAGGIETDDTISLINLGSGVNAVDYNFCEKPPAVISGFVFQDGAAISTQIGQSPNVPAVRDGVLTPNDKRLAGIVLELRDGVTGEPILGSATLGDKYPPNQIVTVITDGNGYYEFTGLKAGSYAVFKRQDPTGYIDGINTAGTTGGVVMSAYTQVGQAILDQLTTLPASGDALLNIVVGAGGASTSNNFSEVATLPAYFFIPPAPVNAPQVMAQNVWLLPENSISPIFTPQVDVPKFLYGGTTRNYTWHLSVLDAGHPRGDAATETTLQEVAHNDDAVSWRSADLEQSKWTLTARGADGKLKSTANALFGMVDGNAITGDFNGDGVTDMGVFKDGEWFIDLNGNGQWDDEDLWAKLGKRDDKPVTGDWNGDGKTDIGIYGPAWAKDPHAIKHEPGIPDHANLNQSAYKNHPPTHDNAAIGERSLRLTVDGKARADLIDHVFHYGTAEDIPVTGDWNGDGIDTIGIFHAGKWYRDTDGDGCWSPADRVAHFGQANDMAVAGDWNGDGRTQLGIYREGTFYLDSNGNEVLDEGDEILQMGGAADQPVVGDWDGDGRDEVGVVQNGQVIHGERLTQQLRKSL